MRLRALFVALPLFLIAVPFAIAEEPAVSSAATPAAPDSAFLALPAFDLERTGSEATRVVQVGDGLLIKIVGLKVGGVKDPAKDLKLVVTPGTDPLVEQGWDVGAFERGENDELRLHLSPLKSGVLTLPSLSIVGPPEAHVEGFAPPADSKVGFARTNPWNLNVPSSIASDDPNAQKPEDAQPPVSLRFPWWIIASLAVLGLLGIAVGAYYFQRWYQKTPVKPQAPAAPPQPEDEVALIALNELIEKGPLKQGNFKGHYFRLSEIAKAYLGARYRFDASESTTREVMLHLEGKGLLNDTQLDRLESLFDQLDLVKFTDHVPLPDEGVRLVGVVRDLVKETRRPPIIVQTTPTAPGGSL